MTLVKRFGQAVRLIFVAGILLALFVPAAMWLVEDASAGPGVRTTATVSDVRSSRMINRVELTYQAGDQGPVRAGIRTQQGFSIRDTVEIEYDARDVTRARLVDRRLDRTLSWLRVCLVLAALGGIAYLVARDRRLTARPHGFRSTTVVRVSRAEMDKSPGDVAAMFDDVAPNYDRTNSVLSLGLDRGWRKVVATTVALKFGETALDLAAGTGTSSAAIAALGGHVVACDFSLGMLREGRRRRLKTTFVAGDAQRLPFADKAFDAVTISFGLRNLSDIDTGLAEMLRVTKPGGRLVICEFSHPVFAPFRTAYDNYLMRALPAIATTVSSNPDAYVYLAESIRAWPTQDELAHRIMAAGWTKVKYRNLTGGIVAVHKAVRSEQ